MGSECLFPDAPDSWRRTTLGGLAKESNGGIQTGPFGSQLHASDYVENGIPSIMPKNITVDSIVTDEIARISLRDAERLSKYRVQTGDIVYSRRGDVEKCARVTDREDGWLCGTGCLRVRINSDVVSTEYLHAYLCLPVVRRWIVRHAVGATMPNLNTTILNSLPVIVPPRGEMERIADVWSNISCKILLNQQINQTLEQMAQAIFKSWFVDFEPVKAKIAALEDGGTKEDALIAAMQAISGKDKTQLTRFKAEQPDQYNELRTTAELFPSAMQDSELGEIPEGWDVVLIGDLFTRLKPAKRFSKKQLSPIGLTPVYEQGADILMGYHNGNASFKATPKDPIFIFGDHTCITHIACHDFDISQNVIPIKGKIRPTIWTYYAAQGKQSFQEYRRHWSELIVKKSILAPKCLCEKFSKLASNLLQLQEQKVRENSELSELRDTLLPRLLAGELIDTTAANVMEGWS